MKTIIQAQDLGTFSLEDGSKLTLRQALKENGLNPREWSLADTRETKTTITYTVISKVPKTTPAIQEAAPSPTSDFHFVHATTGADLSGPPTASDPQAPVTLTLPRKDFEEALRVAVDFAGKPTHIPILTNVRLASDGTNLAIHATDLECYWTRALALLTGAPITTAVYASVLYSEVKALDSDVVEVVLLIDSEARTVSVNNRCSIHTSDAEDFPEPPVVSGMEFCISGLPGKLKKVEPAISTDQTRYILNGAQIDFAGGKIIGTDGFRLHYTDIEPTPGVLPVILPHRAVTLMTRHGRSDAITIDDSDARKYVSYPLHGGVMVSRLMEGLFPDWRGVLPQELPIVIEFDAKEFFKIVEGVVPIAGAKSTISLTVNGVLSIETSGDCGRYHWQIPCSTTGKNTESHTLRYNLKYLTDALKSYAGDGPAVIELPQAYGATLVNKNAIVMPIRV